MVGSLRAPCACQDRSYPLSRLGAGKPLVWCQWQAHRKANRTKTRRTWIRMQSGSSGLRLSTSNLGRVPQPPTSAPHPSRLSWGLTARGWAGRGRTQALTTQGGVEPTATQGLDREVSRKSSTSLLGLLAKF